MRITGEEHIGRTVFIYTVIVAALLSCGAGALLIHQQNNVAQSNLDAIEQQLIAQQKAGLKNDVDAVAAWIDRQRTGTMIDHRSYTDTADTDLGSEPPGAGYDAQHVRQVLLSALADDPGVYDENYFFIYELHDMDGGAEFATMLFNPGRPDLEGKKLSDDQPDAAGISFRKAFMKDIRSDGDSYQIYAYNSPAGSDGARIGRKLTYFRLYPEWNWVIAKGVQLDGIDRILSQTRVAQQKDLRRSVLLLVLLFACGAGLALAFSRVAAARVKQTLETYRQTEQDNQAALQALNKSLEHQSRTDSLTSAFNRGYFNQELTRETARSSRYLTPLALVIFGIDHFREINCELGEHGGDKLLREMVDLVHDNIRLTDILARWGGSEFSILAPGIDLEQAVLFAEKLRLLLQEKTLLLDRTITCSFGVSFYDRGEAQSEFVQRVESALSLARDKGGNRCLVLPDRS